MDANALTWFLMIMMHSSGASGAPPQACCATQVQIAVPSFEVPSCKKTTADDCEVPAYNICKAIADANKDASFPIACIAKPK